MVKEPANFVMAMDINSINKHSPWWARCFAIFLGFVVLGSVVNLFYLEIFGINGINHYSFGNEPTEPGAYPENGTDDEQRKYNNSLREWDEYQNYVEMMDELEESNVTELSQIFAFLTVIIGVPAIMMFWTQHEKMMQIGIAFGATKILGDVWVSYISSGIVETYMESIPGGADYSWVARIGIFTSPMCGIFFIALAIVLHNMYHSLNNLPESAFHLKVHTPSNETEPYGDNDVQH